MTQCCACVRTLWYNPGIEKIKYIHTTDNMGCQIGREGVNRQVAQNYSETTLYVKMFGRFSLSLGEKEIFGGSKAIDSQFSRLMQVLLHFRESGISRNQLYDILFYDRKVSDPSHSLRVLIYNTKNKLKEMGLPDVCYIQQDRDIFCWTKEIPVVEDASEFDHYYQQALQTPDPEAKKEYYAKAVETYTAEFLSLQASEIWVAQESRKYREKYNRCVQQLGEYYRQKKEYKLLEKLGISAAKCQPFYYWETLTLDALIHQNRIQEANQFYLDTETYYMEEMNQAMSPEMVRLRNEILTFSPQDCLNMLLDTIQKELFKDRSDASGGYLCSYPVFTGIYQAMVRLFENTPESITLMLCSMTSEDEKQLDAMTIDELGSQLEDAICRSVRRSDVVTRYSRKQYLVLLIHSQSEGCKEVQSRINDNFFDNASHMKLNYHMMPVCA